MTDQNSEDSIDHVVIVPGNGQGDVTKCNFYASLAKSIRALTAGSTPPAAGGEGAQQSTQLRVTVAQMPDPLRARRSIWLPHLRNALGCNRRTLLIGHSVELSRDSIV